MINTKQTQTNANISLLVLNEFVNKKPPTAIKEKPQAMNIQIQPLKKVTQKLNIAPKNNIMSDKQPKTKTTMFAGVRFFFIFLSSQFFKV